MNKNNMLSRKEIEWAYDKCCIGYTINQIADALYVSSKTIQRAFKDRERVRPILVYEGLRE